MATMMMRLLMLRVLLIMTMIYRFPVLRSFVISDPAPLHNRAEDDARAHDYGDHQRRRDVDHRLDWDNPILFEALLTGHKIYLSFEVRLDDVFLLKGLRLSAVPRACR